MPYLGGKELAQVYRRAQSEGFALVANNFAEPNTLLGVLAAHEEKRSDLLVQVTMGAAKFAGEGRPWRACGPWPATPRPWARRRRSASSSTSTT